MADLIQIEHEDAPDVWDLHYSGAWTGSPWTADGPFYDGVTYKYRAKRIIDGVESAYSNQASVVYSAGETPSNHAYYYRSLQED